MLLVNHLLYGLLLFETTMSAQAYLTCGEVFSTTAEARKRIDRHEAAIRNLGIGKTATEWSEWEDQSNEYRNQAVKAFQDGLFSLIALGAEQSAKNLVGGFTPNQARRAEVIFRNAKINNPQLFTILHRVARGHVATAEDAAIVANTYGQFILSKTVDSEKRGEVATWLLGWGVKTPQTALTVSLVNFLASLTWSVVGHDIIHPRLTHLSRVTENQLEAILAVSKPMADDVSVLRKLRADEMDCKETDCDRLLQKTITLNLEYDACYAVHARCMLPCATNPEPYKCMAKCPGTCDSMLEIAQRAQKRTEECLARRAQ